MDMWRVLIADDHKMVRQGVRSLLEEEPDFDIVGEAADGVEAVDLAKQLKPDILVTDLKMPRLNGLQVARRLRKAVPDTRIIVLTMIDDEVYVAEALEAGAQGYVVKDSGIDELIEAIHTVGRGGCFISRRIDGGTKA